MVTRIDCLSELPLLLKSSERHMTVGASHCAARSEREALTLCDEMKTSDEMDSSTEGARIPRLGSE